jgi:hypothetical protein
MRNSRAQKSSPKASDSSSQNGGDASSHDKSSVGSSEPKNDILKVSSSKLTSIFRAPPKIPDSAKVAKDDDSSDSDDEQQLKISDKSDNQSVHSKESHTVDAEGYVIRKPERKQSTTSDSSWGSDDDGKIDTRHIKVKSEHKKKFGFFFNLKIKNKFDVTFTVKTS